MPFKIDRSASRLMGAIASTMLPIGFLPAAANAATINFAQPVGQAPTIVHSFSQGGVTVTGSNSLYIGFSQAVDNFDPDFPLVVAETNGIGVVGGDVSSAFFPEVTANANAFVDSGESLRFNFDGLADNVLLTLFPGSTIDLDNAFSDPGVVEAFGASGNSLGLAAVTDTSFNVSSAFNNQTLIGFQFVSAADIGTSVSSVTFEDAASVPGPSPVFGIALLGLNAFRRLKRQAD